MESLYRKYRPQTFADVVGQSHVVTTLERAITEGRTSHAYLFCGPRGTGKTTMARLLAKALMCDAGPGVLPDGSCEQCVLIAAGEHPDVYELDAASRTGVDNVREEIVASVAFAPVRGRAKVYIIDEVHMLTQAAFNALLKTLEEPPDHVVFVLCTTDPQKVPETILSRVQRFDFHAISDDDVVARLSSVAEREKISADAEALALIARHARGGMRDALGSLEQLATFGAGTVSRADAEALLGATATSELARISTALATRDIAALFAEVAVLADAGHDLLAFVRELAARLRDVYVVAAVGAQPGIITSTDKLDAIASEAAAFGSADRVAHALAVLADAALAMRTAPNQRLVLEIALTRIARPATDLTLEALADRVATLEAKLDLFARPGAVTPTSVATQSPKSSRSPVQEQGSELSLGAPAPSSVPSGMPATAPSGTPASSPAPSPLGAAAPAPSPAPSPSVASAPASAPSPAPSGAPSPVPAPASPAPTPASAPSSPAPSGMSQAVSSAPAGSVDEADLQRRWKQMVAALIAASPSRGSLLANATLETDDGAMLHVTLPKGSTFAAKMLLRQDVQATIAPIAEKFFGKRQISYAESSLQATNIARATRAGMAGANIGRADQAEAVRGLRERAAAGAVSAAPVGAPADASPYSANTASASTPSSSSFMEKPHGQTGEEWNATHVVAADERNLSSRLSSGAAQASSGSSSSAPAQAAHTAPSDLPASLDAQGLPAPQGSDISTHDANVAAGESSYPLPWEAPPYDDLDQVAYDDIETSMYADMASQMLSSLSAPSTNAQQPSSTTAPMASADEGAAAQFEPPNAPVPTAISEHDSTAFAQPLPQASAPQTTSDVSAVLPATTEATAASGVSSETTSMPATNDLTDEQRSVLHMLTEVFGEGVTMH